MNKILCKIKKVLIISLTIISAFVGAGFASGAEIASFFVNFQFLSIHFAFLSCLILNLFIFFTLSNKTESTITNSQIFKFFSMIILSILSASMFSALNELSLSFSKIQILPIICIPVLFLILKNGLTKMSKICSILCLIILVGIIIVCSLSFSFPNKQISSATPNILSPILYIALNCFCIYPILSSYKNNTTKQENIIIATVTSTTIFTLIILILIALQKIPNSTLPLLLLAKSINTYLYIPYIFILFASIFTTLVSCLYGLCKHTQQYIPNNNFNILFCITISYTLSVVGFNKIIAIFYPLAGFVCLAFGIIALFQKIKPTAKNTQTNNPSFH